MDKMENFDENEFIKKLTSNIRIAYDENFPTFEDDPVILKKAEEMYEAIKKNPLPEHIMKLIQKD